MTETTLLHKHPQYLWYKDRLATFTMWPPQLMQNKRTLARCGLFYGNVSDHVTCFSCGLTLYGWKPTDNPWIEHYRLSKDCSYLKLVGMESFDLPNTSAPQRKATVADNMSSSGWQPMASQIAGSWQPMTSQTANGWQSRTTSDSDWQLHSFLSDAWDVPDKV